MRVRVSIVFFLGSLVICPAAFAQFVGKPYIINYDKRTYGADNQNWSVAAGSDGVVYAGNDRGLLEFDGSNWRIHQMPDNGIVRSVMAGDDGNIYVGSYEEFGYWKRDHTGRLSYTSLSRAFLADQRLHNDEIWRIIQHDGKLYFQSFSNIFIYNGQEIKIIKPETSFVLLMKARERLFIHVVDRGLFEIRQDSLHFMPGSGMLASDEIKVMVPVFRDKFLAGASGSGLYLYDGQTFEVWEDPVNNEIRNSNLNNAISGHGLIGIGTVGNGIYLFDSDGNFKYHLNTFNALQNNTVLGLDFDQAGNIWAALDRGIDFINLNNPIDYYVDPSGTMGSVYAAIMDGPDLLIGTNQGLYRYRFDPDRGFIDPLIINGLQGQVWDLKYFDGAVYCGHNSGTYRLKGGVPEKISGISGGFEIKRFRNGNRDYLLQSTYSAFALYAPDHSGWRLDHSIAGFFEPIKYFEADHQGNIWAIHAIKDLFRLRLSPDLKSFESVLRVGSGETGTANRLLSVAMVEGRPVFTSTRGILTWDDLNDSIIPYISLNQEVGEFSMAQQIIKARDNYYWFVKGNELGFFRISGDVVKLVFRYDLFMQGLYINSRYPKIIALMENLHLICLDNGFALYDEDARQETPTRPKLILREATAQKNSGKTIALPVLHDGKSIRVKYPFRNLYFVFSSNGGYVFPLYRTRLLGLEKDWSSWAPSSSVEFRRLPKGDYRLQVEAKDINGLPIVIIEYPIDISAPWYNSVVSRILYFLLLVGGGIFMRLVFLKRLRIHKLEIEKTESEKRIKEAMTAEKEMIRLKNEKLQSQIDFKNTQLADYTMSTIRKNEQLIKIREEIQRHSKESGLGSSRQFLEKIIRMVDKQISSEEDWNTFETHFDQAHQDYIRRLKLQYPDLTQSDLKLCAFLRLNISSKGIARLLNISIRGVEVRRYRLRKRLNLDSGQNLYDFLLNF